LKNLSEGLSIAFGRGFNIFLGVWQHLSLAFRQKGQVVIFASLQLSKPKSFTYV